MNANCFGSTGRETPHGPPLILPSFSLSSLSLLSSSLFFPSSQAVNKAMEKQHQEYNIGVLDIYGFEIFQVILQPKIPQSWLPAR